MLYQPMSWTVYTRGIEDDRSNGKSYLVDKCRIGPSHVQCTRGASRTRDKNRVECKSIVSICVIRKFWSKEYFVSIDKVSFWPILLKMYMRCVNNNRSKRKLC